MLNRVLVMITLRLRSMLMVAASLLYGGLSPVPVRWQIQIERSLSAVQQELQKERKLRKKLEAQSAYFDILFLTMCF